MNIDRVTSLKCGKAFVSKLARQDSMDSRGRILAVFPRGRHETRIVSVYCCCCIRSSVEVLRINPMHVLSICCPHERHPGSQEQDAVNLAD